MASYSSNPFQPLDGIADQLAELLVRERERLVRDRNGATGRARVPTSSDRKLQRVSAPSVVGAQTTSAPPHTDTLVLDDETGGADSFRDHAKRAVSQADVELIDVPRQSRTSPTEETSAMGGEGSHAEQSPVPTDSEVSSPVSTSGAKAASQARANGVAQHDEFLKQKLEWQTKCRELETQLERRTSQVRQLHDRLRSRQAELVRLQRELLESATPHNGNSRGTLPADVGNGKSAESPKQVEQDRTFLAPSHVDEKGCSAARESEDFPSNGENPAACDAPSLPSASGNAEAESAEQTNRSINGAKTGVSFGTNGNHVNGNAADAESNRSTDRSVVQWMRTSSKRVGPLGRFWRRYFP